MEESLKTLVDYVIYNVFDKVSLWLCDLNAIDIGRRLGRRVFVLSARTYTFGLLCRCTHTLHISLSVYVTKKEGEMIFGVRKSLTLGIQT